MKRAQRTYGRKTEPLSSKVVLMMTAPMRTDVERAAIAAGLPMSEWVRFLIREALDRG